MIGVEISTWSIPRGFLVQASEVTVNKIHVVLQFRVTFSLRFDQCCWHLDRKKLNQLESDETMSQTRLWGVHWTSLQDACDQTYLIRCVALGYIRGCPEYMPYICPLHSDQSQVCHSKSSCKSCKPTTVQWVRTLDLLNSENRNIYIKIGNIFWLQVKKNMLERYIRLS